MPCFIKVTIIAFHLSAIRRTAFRRERGSAFGLARLESGQAGLMRGPVLLHKVIRGAVADLEPAAARKGITIDTDIGQDLPEIIADGMQIERALQNLLANAIKYNKWGGTIKIFARRLPEEDIVRIEVSDTGVGIPAEDLPHVFDRYYRCQGSAGVRGAGLGLAIVKAAVEAHGGRVAASSDFGFGSKFTLELPARLSDERMSEAA